MRDDPRRNLKWLEQELLAEDNIHRDFSKLPDKDYHKDEDLLELVDMLIEEDASPEAPPVRNFTGHSRKVSKGERAARAQAPAKLEENAYIPVKTKKQLRREAKLRKQAEKKETVNRNLKGLTFLAALETLGILVLLGWWLQ